MTRQELAEKVNLAYDEYFDAIQELGTDAGIVPPSPRLVQDDPRTAERADRNCGAEFEAEQTLSQSGIFGRHRGETPRRRKTA